ncbi:hypothetical protein ABGB12_03580 [Actinocorallia sp. B10E7]|uniref:hypothetical protein n=1 Tax=Actinocorallia sp. B10E7 TaxID=3153558 RepID=UPI00325E0380
MRPALACALVLPLAACASHASGGGYAPSGTAPPAPPPPRSAGPPPLAVLDAYREFHRVLESSLATNTASRIPEVTAEPFASRLTGLVEEQHRRSVVRRTHLALNPRLAWIGNRTALVLDCVSSPGLAVFDASTGRRLGPRPVAEQKLVEIRLKLEDSWLGQHWKVARISEVRAC